MLGYLLGVTLALTIFTPLLLSEVYADSFVVNFDKQQYLKGGSLTISGSILDFGMPTIGMSVFDPNGKILSANNLDISPQKTFSRLLSLDSPFYEKTGEYMIKLDYGQISKNYYFIVENEYSEPEIFVEGYVKSEIILLNTDKKQYTDNEIIKITGLVSTLDSSTVLMGIYDPFGMPTGFYFSSIDPNLEFSTTVLVKSGINFKVDGTYSIKAHYAETEAISFFNYYEVTQPIIEEDSETEIMGNNDVEENIEKQSVQIISDATNISTDEIIITEDESDNNYNSNTEILIEDNSQKYESQSNDNTIIQNQTKKIEIKKQINLTVQDIKLGKLLNQINLACDSSIFTDKISYYDGMGPALYRLCKFDSSLNFFNESLINNPNDVKILVNKGSTLGKLGYFSEAIVYYDQAININPNFLPAKNNKANALANLGNYDQAISLYNEILMNYPNYIAARKNLEIALSEIPQIPNIVDVIEKYDTENIIYHKTILSEQPISLEHKKHKSINFFEEVSIVFSSLGAIFGF